MPSPSDRLPPDEARELIRRAFDYGSSDLEIASITGLGKCAVQRLRLGRTKFITRDSHMRIIRTLADNNDLRAFTRYSRVPAKWSRAMVCGLIAQGWTTTHQRRLLQENRNVSGGFIPSVSAGRFENVYYIHQEQIRWLVSEIGATRGPSKRAMAWARNNGHFPTKHYDVEGDLIVKSLPKELRQAIEGV